jgi:hypothetical protein
MAKLCQIYGVKYLKSHAQVLYLLECSIQSMVSVHVHIAQISNLSANDTLNWEMLEGINEEGTNLLMFSWYENIYYEDRVPTFSETIERLDTLRDAET